MGTMVSRKLRELTDSDIAKIAESYNTYTEGSLENVKGFCAVVNTEEIAPTATLKGDIPFGRLGETSCCRVSEGTWVPMCRRQWREYGGLFHTG